MRLERTDAELFYRLWFPLLDFVNNKYHVCPEAGPIDRELGVDACDAKAIADYLWSHTGVIEEYLTVPSCRTNMPRSWQAGSDARLADIFWNAI